jgi:hypothetical protein
MAKHDTTTTPNNDDKDGIITHTDSRARIFVAESGRKWPKVAESGSYMLGVTKVTDEHCSSMYIR